MPRPRTHQSAAARSAAYRARRRHRKLRLRRLFADFYHRLRDARFETVAARELRAMLRARPLPPDRDAALRAFLDMLRAASDWRTLATGPDGLTYFQRKRLRRETREAKRAAKKGNPQ